MAATLSSDLPLKRENSSKRISHCSHATSLDINGLFGRSHAMPLATKNDSNTRLYSRDVQK
jgi:hypothetical protein